MPTFKTPGQYVEELSKFKPVWRVSTSIAAFIGSAKSGPYNDAVLVSSFSEFERTFGGFVSSPVQHLAYAVDMFFKNGGKKAYIVRAAETASAKAPLRTSSTISRKKYSEAGEADDEPLSIDLDAALSALENINDISIIAAPGVYSKDVYEKLITHCSRMGYRFAILDPPPGCDVEQMVNIRSREMVSSSGMAAVYYPWLGITDPITKEMIYVPPSGAVAGVYAATDNNSGVHKAPANVSLQYVLGLEANVSNQEQEALNLKNINPIRVFSGKGFLVWGARTISDSPDWRYIPVRRSLMYLEQSIRNGMQQTVSGPNEGKLWVKVKADITQFLTQEWKNGMMMGPRPEDAFFVRCGLGETMTTDDILNERLIVQIGVAAVRPAEFIMFTISWEL
ncbi:MAG: phage tail sheath subtilisin-like domain-containing protein [Methanomassiliicoccaceae archaeon]|jgi:phage tail sheath protein FI|nr:phage tail sheath subtilisin-like domain-containing protein [Methanomassiliicoccaceae archaeon]